MTNFYQDVIQADPRFHSADPVRDMALLEPTFRLQVTAFLAKAKAAGTELMVTETYRSSELQQKYFAEGKTQLQAVGVHHYGLACDFAKLVNGQPSWDGDWTFCVELAKQVSTADRIVISGVDWGRPGVAHSFVDSDHIQGCTIEQQTGLFAGTWYPETWHPDSTATPAIAPIPAPPANIPVVNHANLTANQSAALAAFDVVNAESFGNWFNRSSFMAFCETESDFEPKAFRQEPSGVASYGLMQVLDSTAADLGLVGDPAQMYDPKTGILYGLKYAAQGWNYLFTHLGAGHPTLEEWCAGYNEGYGAAASGRPDQLYVTTWMTNRAKWLYLDAPATEPTQAVATPTSAPTTPTPAPTTPTRPPVAAVQMFNPDDIACMPALEQLQRWLVADGANIEVDGQFGPKTLAAIEAAYK